MVTEGPGGSGEQHHRLNTTTKPTVHPCNDGTNGGCDQICIRQGKAATCSCKPDFTLQEDGVSCELLPPCERKDNGGCEQHCKPSDAEEGFTCACNEGFKLAVNRKNCTEGEVEGSFVSGHF